MKKINKLQRMFWKAAEIFEERGNETMAENCNIKAEHLGSFQGNSGDAQPEEDLSEVENLMDTFETPDLTIE